MQQRQGRLIGAAQRHLGRVCQFPSVASSSSLTTSVARSIEIIDAPIAYFQHREPSFGILGLDLAGFYDGRTAEFRIRAPPSGPGKLSDRCGARTSRVLVGLESPISGKGGDTQRTSLQPLTHTLFINPRQGSPPTYPPNQSQNPSATIPTRTRPGQTE